MAPAHVPRPGPPSGRLSPRKAGWLRSATPTPKSGWQLWAGPTSGESRRLPRGLLERPRARGGGVQVTSKDRGTAKVSAREAVKTPWC